MNSTCPRQGGKAHWDDSGNGKTGRQEKGRGLSDAGCRVYKTEAEEQIL